MASACPTAVPHSENETQSYDILRGVMTARGEARSARRSRPAPTQTASSPATAGPAIELVGAAAQIGGRAIWRDVSVRVGRGAFVALLGANGSGKSTLLKAVLGALPLTAGSVTVLGKAPGAANRSIGYLPQRRSFDQGTRLRGRDIVRLGLDGDRWGLPLPLAWGRPGARRRAERDRVDEVIEMVGAGSHADRPIGESSGGEQQRLLIAQALVRRPELLLLDEPLDSLDLPNQAAVAALVAEICRGAGVAVLLVAHDVNPLLPYLDRILYLAAGRAVAGTPQQVITGETLSALYGTPIEVLRTSDGRMVVVGHPEGHHAHGPRHVLE
jgi:zinc/manganese transport system ATP-binding protein